MFDFDQDLSFKFKFEEKDYSVRYATKSDVAFFLDNSKEQDVSEADASYNFLDRLGAPKEVLEKLPMKCVGQLVEEALDQKK